MTHFVLLLFLKTNLRWNFILLLILTEQLIFPHIVYCQVFVRKSDGFWFDYSVTNYQCFSHYLILGTITTCFDGVIRGILLNQIPTLFRKEIYATACIFGGIVFFLLQKLNLSAEIIEIITILTIFGIRIIAVKMNISLPKID